MEVFDFLEFLQKAKEKEIEERLFSQWVIQLPYMNNENYISFEGYIDKQTGRNIDTRSNEEIINEILELHEQNGMEVNLEWH